MKRHLFIPALGIVGMALAVPAHAQTRGWLDTTQSYSAPDQASFYDSQRAAYDNGFREGLKEGEKDGRKTQLLAIESCECLMFHRILESQSCMFMSSR